VALPKNLHHYVVRACEGKFPPEKHGMPIGRGEGTKCWGNFGGWVPGRNIREMPSWAGFPIGKGAGIQSFVVNIHYDNPEHEEGLVSTDGMRLHYTPTLRSQTVSAFSTMQVSYNPTIEIPPHKQRYFLTRGCDVTVQDKAGNDVEAQILMVSHHAHLLGTEMYVQRTRGQDKYTISNEDVWYFDDQFQKNIYLDNVTLKTGDRLQTTCVFDSRKRDSATLIGIETTDEMCWGSFMFTRGDVRTRCDGPIWTGELAKDEPALGLEVNHLPKDADGVWSGDNLRTGGISLNLKGMGKACNNLAVMSTYCPMLAKQQANKPESCDKTYGDLGVSVSRIANMKPLQTCCDSFCESACPNHEACLPPTTTTTTTTTTAESTAFEPTSEGTASHALCVGIAVLLSGRLVSMLP